MSWHLFWLWMWFGVGTFVYMLKRAYFLVKGPNPVAHNYREFIHACWIPLLVRAAVDGGLYWLTFYPEMLNWAIGLTPWKVQLHSPIPEYAIVAFFFGMGIDSVMDFAVTKIPYVKDWLPQMPPPLLPHGQNGGM